MKSGFLKTDSSKKGRVGSEDSLSVFVLLLCLVVFFSPILFFGQSLYYSDFSFITYPVKSFLAQTFQAGALPYWTPSIDSGTPFMAAFHTGVFYPPSIIFLLPDTNLALNLFYIFHFIILIIPTYYLARSWDLSGPAALCSSITALLSSFFLSSTMLSNWFLAAVWLPLVFLLFQKFIIEKKALYFIAATLALFCQILAASPELCILTVLLLLAHSLVLIPREKISLSLYGRMVALATMVILALGASALQLLPTYELIEHSLRKGGLPFETHSYRSMAIKQLGELVLPNNFDEYFSGNRPGGRITTFFISIYMGLIPLLCLVVAIGFRGHKAIQFWLGVFLIGIFLASGAHNPVYKWIYSWTPLMSLFRFPEKFFNVSAFALIFLTGHVLDMLVAATLKREIRLHRVFLPLVLVFGSVVVASIAQPEKNALLSLITLSIFGGFYLLFYFGKLRSSLFYASILLLLGVDLASQGYKVMPTVDNEFYQSQPELLAPIKNEHEHFRVYTGKIYTGLFKGFPNEPNIEGGYYAAREHLYPYFGMIFGVEYPNGILGIGLELKNPWVWSEWFRKSSPAQRIRILERSNVKHWIDGDSPTMFVEGRPTILPDRLKSLKAPLPRAFMVPNMRHEKETHILSAYYDESFDPLSAVLLSETMEFEASPHFNGNVDQVIYRPNRVTIKTHQEGNGFLVLMDSYFPGWTVKVDGQAKPVLRANHFYRAVRLGPGEHVLEFEYFPEGLKLGLVISGISVLLLALGGLFWEKYLTRSV
jgi:Bacterial membrane protein YfhO